MQDEIIKDPVAKDQEPGTKKQKTKQEQKQKRKNLLLTLKIIY